MKNLDHHGKLFFVKNWFLELAQMKSPAKEIQRTMETFADHDPWKVRVLDVMEGYVQEVNEQEDYAFVQLRSYANYEKVKSNVFPYKVLSKFGCGRKKSFFEYTVFEIPIGATANYQIEPIDEPSKKFNE